MTGDRRRLVIIGGAEDKRDECTVLREFARFCGGTRARIAVLTAATSLPGEVGADYLDVFERLGVETVRVIDTDRREDADRPEHLQVIQESTGVFFTGGNQAKIIEYLNGTQMHALLRQRNEAGELVIAGTSAGAAMMPETMIVEGESETNPRVDRITLGPGMGFLPGAVIDQHFAQRGRLGRLIAALVQQPVVLGFGIDEDTAMVIDGDEMTVIGTHSVTVVDESEGGYNNLDRILKDEPMAVCGVKLHILPHGFRFNLKTRQPLTEGAPPATAENAPAAKMAS